MGAEQEIFNHPGEKKQSNGLWKKQQGMVQSAEFDPKKDLGELTKIKITTNNKYTGLGSGVYYVPVNRAIFDKDSFEAFTKPKSGNRKMTKCSAQFCEEEMDKKLGFALAKAMKSFE